jgi:tetratricopeptide (TPR) repeat protein
MKNIVISIVIFLILLSNAEITGAQSQDRYETDHGVVDVKTIDPVEMVSESVNARAMEAYNAGTHFLRQNRLEDAEKYLLEAVRLEPEFVDAMDHLGILYRRLNRFEEAEYYYLKSISINDKNKVPFINLAVVYRIQGRLNEAYNLYLKVIGINQSDPEGYYGAGELFYITGNYENAMLFFNIALELYKRLNSPLVYDVYYYIGMIYFAANNYDEALGYLEEAQTAHPNNESIQRAINQIRNSR